MPAFIALAVMVFAVHEPARHEADAKPRLRLADATRLSGRFWAVVGVATILTLARFSEAFLILRSQNVGLPVALVPTVMVVMNVVYALRGLSGRRALRPAWPRRAARGRYRVPHRG